MKYSQEFIDKMHKLLGDETPSFFDALENPCSHGLTVNFSRIERQDFESKFNQKHSVIPETSNGYYVDSFKIGNHILSHLGIIYSQEPSAMYPVEMLDINEGDIVLDLCASPGGKSIQILEKLNGTGLLVSNEIVFNRAKILYENLNRMGFKNFVITCNNPEDYEKTNLKFDKIIVDAPCGGEGMFRKDNFDFDAYNNASIDTNARRQKNILNSIKNLLKPNGKLVYSTCTYDIRENESVIADFLDNNEDYTILEYPRLDSVTVEGIKVPPHATNYCKRRYPHKFSGEGQFMALLTRIGKDSLDDIEYKFSAKGYSATTKKDSELLRAIFKDVADISDLTIVKRNDNYYALPDEVLDFENLNVVSVGCLIGSINGKVIKIAHEFYHTYGEFFYNKIELTDNQVSDYLKGLEIATEKPNGVYAVYYLSQPLGGGKVAGNRLKNYYPKNLRIN